MLLTGAPISKLPSIVSNMDNAEEDIRCVYGPGETPCKPESEPIGTPTEFEVGPPFWESKHCWGSLNRTTPPNLGPAACVCIQLHGLSNLKLNLKYVDFFHSRNPYLKICKPKTIKKLNLLLHCFFIILYVHEVFTHFI